MPIRLATDNDRALINEYIATRIGDFELGMTPRGEEIEVVIDTDNRIAVSIEWDGTRFLVAALPRGANLRAVLRVLYVAFTGISARRPALADKPVIALAGPDRLADVAQWRTALPNVAVTPHYSGQRLRYPTVRALLADLEAWR